MKKINEKIIEEIHYSFVEETGRNNRFVIYSANNTQRSTGSVLYKEIAAFETMAQATKYFEEIK